MRELTRWMSSSLTRRAPVMVDPVGTAGRHHQPELHPSAFGAKLGSRSTGDFRSKPQMFGRAASGINNPDHSLLLRLEKSPDVEQIAMKPN